MNRYYHLAIFTGIAASSLVVQHVLAQNQGIYEQGRKSVVLIQNTAGVRQGTGFIVSRNEKDGTYIYYVLTAGHVVRNGQFQIRTDSGEVKPVDVFASSSADDLALLQFSSSQQYQPVNTATNANSVQAGASLLILGYPASGTGEPEIVNGIVTSRQNPSSISHNLETKLGMSGSPVLDISGNVVGIHIGLDSSNFREAIPIERYKISISQIILQAATTNLAAGKFIEAIASIEERRRLLGQDDPESSTILAYAYFGKGDIERAKEEANKARRTGGDKEELIILLGAINYLQENFSEAIANLSLINNSRTFRSYALAVLGLSYASIGNQTEATRNTLNAVQALPTDALVYFARSYANHRSGNDPEARLNFATANTFRGQKPINVFLVVLSTRLQEATINRIPPPLREPLSIVPDSQKTPGRYKSSEPINLVAGVTAIAVSRDSQSIAIGLRDGSVSIYNLQTKKLESFNPANQFETFISSIAFSRNGRNIAIAASNGQVKVFNIQSKEEKYRLADAGQSPQVVFSDNNQLLFVGSGSGTLRMVDNTTGEVIASEGNTNSRSITSLILSPDGRLLASGDDNGVVKLWGTSNLNTVDSYQAYQARVQDGFRLGVVQALTFASDGIQIISADFDIVKTCNWQTKQCEEITRSGKVIRSLAVSPTNGHVAYSADNSVFLQDQRIKQSLGALLDHKEPVNTLAYTPDGRYLISGSDDKTIIIWEVQ